MSGARGPGAHSGGQSIMWILFLPIVLVVVIGFLASVVLGHLSGSEHLTLAQRLEPMRLAAEAGKVFPTMLLFTGLMIASLYFTLRLGLYPLRRISEQAAQIGPSTLDARLPLSSAPREVAPLVMAFNAALDRLEAGWRAQRHFSANAAHELRNPLATLRAQVESLLGSDERAAAVEEFERLGRLVEQLLDLAEAEGGASGATGAFDIVALSRAIARDMASRIIASERTLSFETALDRHIVNGQADLAEMALRNLLDNAVRHTPKGAEILLAIDAQGVTSVIDDGPGVIADLKPRLFQRFSRGDPNGAGAGLGLSIVRQVMERNGGSVWLADLPRGACFSLQFRTSRDLV